MPVRNIGGCCCEGPPAAQCEGDPDTIPAVDLHFAGTFNQHWQCGIGVSCSPTSGTVTTVIDKPLVYYANSMTFRCENCGFTHTVNEFWLTPLFCVRKYQVPIEGLISVGFHSWQASRLLLACTPTGSGLAWKAHMWNGSSQLGEPSGGSSTSCRTGFPNDPLQPEPNPPPDYFYGDFTWFSGEEVTPTRISSSPIDWDIAGGLGAVNPLGPYSDFTGTITE